MYKDKDRQREANRQAQQRRRRQQGMTVIDERSNEPSDVIPITPSGQGMTGPKHSYIGAVPETPDTTIPKRGLDIKCFADLPPDVQATINRLSESNEEKQKRTQIAINYQHLFPSRFNSTGRGLVGEIKDGVVHGIKQPRIE